MELSKQEFKRRWESNDKAGGITFEDIADCAEAWGIIFVPRTKNLFEVRYAVLKSAGVEDAEDYNPNN